MTSESGGKHEPSSQSSESSSPETPALARIHIWQFQAVRDVLLIAAIIAIVWLGYALRVVTIPLLVALLLAYLFEPIVSRLSAHPRLNRPVVVIALLATVGVVFVLVLVIITSMIVSETTRLIEEIREERVQKRLVALREYLPEQQRQMVDRVFEWLIRDVQDEDMPPFVPDELTDDENDSGHSDEVDAAAEEELFAAVADGNGVDEARLRAIVREELAQREQQVIVDPEAGWQPIEWLGLARGGAGAVWTFIGGLIQAGFVLFLIPFYFFFFSVAYPRIVEFGKSLIPDRKKDRAHELLGKMDAVIAGFVRGRIIISIIMGVMFAFGWWLCGVPYAIVLGLVTGIFCAVPFLGIIGVPAAVGLLFYDQFDPETGLQMAWWQIILWPTLVFVIVQAIESYAITPAIAGKATNLDPVTIIVAVIAGGTVMGIYGMLLAIPVAACLKIVITDVLMPKIRAWTRGEAADPLPIE